MHQAYYATSAGVIPVLILVVFVGEGRVVKREGWDPQHRESYAWMGIGAMFVMFLGELCALRALGQGHDTYLLQHMTSLAVVYGFLFVLMQGAKLLLLDQPESFPLERLQGLDRPIMAAILIVTFGSLEIISPGFPF
jgi:hypothetical protein